MIERQKLITDIIHFKGDMNLLESELMTFPWDWTDPQSLYTVKNDDMLMALELLNNGVINIDIIEKWANIIEGREDIDYESDIIHEVINELANPILFGDLSSERIVELKGLLSRA